MISRRRLLQTAGAALGAGLVDQGLGFLHEAVALRHHPKVELLPNYESDRAILVAGGLNNDGIAIGRAMAHVLQPIGSVISVRYAETNLDPEPLHDLVSLALQKSNPVPNRVDAYLNSEAGVIMAAPLRRLSAVYSIGTVVLDGAPASSNDVRGFEGTAVKKHGDVLAHSRLLNWATHFVAEQQMPPATDKEPTTPLALSEAHRQAIVNTDSITTGMEAGFLRDHPALPGSWSGVAQRIMYMCAQTDPLVDIDSSLAGWRSACGGADSVEKVIDPYRPAVSHAAGPTYPAGVGLVLQS